VPIFGGVCDTGVSLGDGPGAVIAITSPVPGCASNVCLLPAGDIDPINTGALCTSGCNTSDDCRGGMTGAKDDPTDRRCKNGFVCIVPTTVGAYCCQRMCVCRDFLAEPVGGFQTPAPCMPGAVTTCANVQ
jgi:hypothetical protein